MVEEYDSDTGVWTDTGLVTGQKLRAFCTPWEGDLVVVWTTDNGIGGISIFDQVNVAWASSSVSVPKPPGT